LLIPSFALPAYSCDVNLEVADVAFHMALEKVHLSKFDMAHFAAFFASEMAMARIAIGINSFPVAGIGMKLPLFHAAFKEPVYSGYANTTVFLPDSIMKRIRVEQHVEAGKFAFHQCFLFCLSQLYHY